MRRLSPFRQPGHFCSLCSRLVLTADTAVHKCVDTTIPAAAAKPAALHSGMRHYIANFARAVFQGLE